MENDKKEAKTPKTKEYIAIKTERVGSNPDGSPKFNFKTGEPIALTTKEAKRFSQYVE